MAETLLKAIQTDLLLGEKLYSPQVSIGIAIAPDAGTSLGILLKMADTAMYKSKQSGGNTYVIDHQAPHSL